MAACISPSSYSYSVITVISRCITWHDGQVSLPTLKEARKVFFGCCSVCETMEDYKEGYLIVWANYMSPYNSIVGLYSEGTCDVISVTMATHKVHKNVH